MGRRLLNLLSVLSLLLCVAVVALWVTSYAAEARVEFRLRGVAWGFTSTRGTLRLDNEPQREIERQRFLTSVARDMDLLRQLNEKADLLHERTPAGDFHARQQAMSDELLKVQARLLDANARQAAVPSTAYVQFSIRHGVSAAGAALPLVASLAAVLYARRRRVRMLGLCPRCGYDLRATPGRCPECGTEPRNQTCPPERAPG